SFHGPGNAYAVGQVEAPWPVGCLGEANPCGLNDRPYRGGGAANLNVSRVERKAVLLAGQSQGLTDAAGSAAQPLNLHRSAAQLHRLDPADGFQCSDQNGFTCPYWPGNGICAPVDAINEIGIQVARRPKHNPVPSTNSTIRMGCRIVPKVCFGLNYDAGRRVSTDFADQYATQQILRDRESLSIVKPLWQRSAEWKSCHQAMFWTAGEIAKAARRISACSP